MDQWGEVDSAVSGYCPMAGFCEHGNEPSSSIKKKAGYCLTPFTKNILHHVLSTFTFIKTTVS